MADTFMQKALASVGLGRSTLDPLAAFEAVQALHCTKEWDTSGHAIALHLTYHDELGNVVGTVTHSFNEPAGEAQ